MRQIAAVFAFAIIVACKAANSESAATVDPARATDAFMKLIVADKVDEAFKTLRANWPMPSNELDTLTMQTVQQRNLAAPRFGKPLGYTLIREEKLSDFAVRYPVNAD